MAGAELLPGMETAMDARIVARLIAEEGMTPKADLPRFMSTFEEKRSSSREAPPKFTPKKKFSFGRKNHTAGFV